VAQVDLVDRPVESAEYLHLRRLPCLQYQQRSGVRVLRLQRLAELMLLLKDSRLKLVQIGFD
jgi:hypothetical protein